MADLKLSWQPGFSLSRKPVKKKLAPRAKGGALAGEHGPKQFKFIVEHPASRHQSKLSLSTNSSKVLGAFGENRHHERSRIFVDRDDVDLVLTPKTKDASLAPNRTGSQNRVDESFSTTIRTPSLLSASGFTSLNSNIFESESMGEEYSAMLQLSRCVSDGEYDSGDNLDEAYEISHHACAINPSVTKLFKARTMPFPFISSPSSVMFTSLIQKFGPILERYDVEFCKIPLTTNIQMNPFRCHVKIDAEPMFLVHAVMALAGHHVKSTMTQVHRHAALQLLRQNLQKSSFANFIGSMLDTIIVLFSLDETQSIMGGWNTHLLGAYSLLETCGWTMGWTVSARLQAQVGLLLWWDAIISLLSREDCVFPYSYFEALLENYDGQKWDYFGLCGCPLSLVKAIMHLARLGTANRNSSSIQYINFDMNILEEVERILESWHHEPAETALNDEESMQQDQDKMHCSEAWRHGLLLYIFRVYHWKSGTSVPVRMIHRARIILDHVFACRDASMVPKQALLPLFFAGCETGDLCLRKQITGFCSSWNDRTRYQMIGDTSSLLKEVWTEQESKGFDNVWWGQVVDARHRSASSGPLKMRLCFG